MSKNPDIEKRLDKIIELLGLLLIKNSDERPRQPVPDLPPFPRVPDISYKSSLCEVCGMNFDGVHGYVCGHPNCPSRVVC